MSNFENKIIKKKKLDKESSLLISKNEMSNRIFVDFVSEDGKLKLQKSFQDTYEGNRDSQAFAKSIKSIEDLRKYFGLNAKKYKGIDAEITINEQKVTSYKDFKEKK